MDFTKLTEQTIFLNNFFTDLEIGCIYYDKDDEVIVIEKDSNVYSEMLENITDLCLPIQSNIGKAIQRRMLSTIVKYYNEFADTDYTNICIRSIIS